jgi:hypothetical protein
MIGVSLAVGMAITSAVPSIAWDGSTLPNWLTQNLNELAATARGTEIPIRLRGGTTQDELGEAARRIFGNETHESLDEAHRYLRSIPAESPAYDNAQALLQAAESRRDGGNGKDTGVKAPVEILSSAQNGGRLSHSSEQHGQKYPQHRISRVVFQSGGWESPRCGFSIRVYWRDPSTRHEDVRSSFRRTRRAGLQVIHAARLGTLAKALGRFSSLPTPGRAVPSRNLHVVQSRDDQVGGVLSKLNHCRFDHSVVAHGTDCLIRKDIHSRFTLSRDGVEQALETGADAICAIAATAYAALCT